MTNALFLAIYKLDTLHPIPHLKLRKNKRSCKQIRYHHQPSCEEDNELACMIHLADVMAKSAGFVAGQSATLDEIAPEILQFLHIQAQDLVVIADAVKDDLQKIKEELKEV